MKYNSLVLVLISLVLCTKSFATNFIYYGPLNSTLTGKDGVVMVNDLKPGVKYSKNANRYSLSGKYIMPFFPDITEVDSKAVIDSVPGQFSTMAKTDKYTWKDGTVKYFTTVTDFDKYYQNCDSKAAPNSGKLDCNIITPKVCEAYRKGLAGMSDSEKFKCQSMVDLVRVRKEEAAKDFGLMAQENMKKITDGKNIGSITYGSTSFDPLQDASSCDALALMKGMPIEHPYKFLPVATTDLQKITNQREQNKSGNSSAR